MKPIITIGMPVFNDVDFIEQSLNSVLEQSESRFVLLISDDCSTDGSAGICKEYAIKDDRIVYVRQSKNMGISKNMEFLLSKANTPYFMWAGDDDLLDIDFVKNHIANLSSSPRSIVSFGRYETIDENNKSVGLIDANFHSKSRFLQLLKLVFKEDDGFGYGVFKTDKIRNVRFPVWWWPNKKTPYNNIFPSLLFYLNNGVYLHQNDVMFYKRVKTGAKVNHTLSGGGNGTKELLSYFLRRFYLINYGFVQMLKSKTWYNAILIYPFLFFKWFIFASLSLTFKSIRNKLN